MQKKIIIAVALALLTLVGGGLLLLSRQAKAPVLVSRTDPPRIRFEEEVHELGNVTAGTEIPYVFKIHNIGGEPLIISSVTAHCTCLLSNLKDKFIEPGKSGDLELILNTTQEKGDIKKQIDLYSNDPDNPKVSVYLAATVIPAASDVNPDKKANASTQASASVSRQALTPVDPHAGLTDADRARIFTGRCASCHVLPGKGKLGEELFQADCAMCHGQNAEGSIGPALAPGNYHDQEFMNRIQKVTRYGSEQHPAMPGFLNEAGGPLTDSEIDSIIQFLQDKSLQMQNGGSTLPGG